MRRKSWEHTTRDEINFLKNLCKKTTFFTVGVLELLNKYRSYMIARVKLGDIKKEVVLDFVDKRIKELSSQV